MAGLEGAIPEAPGSLWGADKAKVCQAWHDKASRVLVVGGGPGEPAWSGGRGMERELTPLLIMISVCSE